MGTTAVITIDGEPTDILLNVSESEIWTTLINTSAVVKERLIVGGTDPASLITNLDKEKMTITFMETQSRMMGWSKKTKPIHVICATECVTNSEKLDGKRD